MGSIVYLSIFGSAIYAGLLYSLAWWILRTIDPTKEDRLFDIVSTLFTMCVAGGLATFILYVYPVIITYNLLIIMLIFASLTAITREVVVTLYRKI